MSLRFALEMCNFTQLEGQLHPEAAALAQHALHAHFATHEFGEMLAYRQPQTRTAKAPRGGDISLSKGCEELG